MRSGAETWCWERPASADLTQHLACVWHAEAGGPPHTLVPDACMDLLWISNGTTWLCGPETSSWTFALPAGTSAVGVRFRPAAAVAVLQLDARDVANSRVGVDELWGAAAGRRVQEQLDDARSPDERIERLTDVVRRRLDGADRDVDPVADAMVARFAGAAPPPVHVLARDLGVSERLLHRRACATFGYGPSVLARILRVQRFLRASRASGRPTGLAEMAAAAGFSDQPHLTREVRAIAGMTPSDVVRHRWFGVRSVQDPGESKRAS